MSNAFAEFGGSHRAHRETDRLFVIEYPRRWAKQGSIFQRFGFSEINVDELKAALVKHATTHEVQKVEQSPFGTRYVVDGIIETPDARNPWIRSVWFIETGDDRPRLVTAYPRKGKTS